MCAWLVACGGAQTSADAGGADAGGADAGTLDAGVPDAGVPDAGPELDTRFTLAPAAKTAAQSVEFAFQSTAAGATFECKRDDGAFAACDSPHTWMAPAEGERVFEVRAVWMGARDGTPARHAFVVDRTPPTALFSQRPDEVTAADTLTFAFTASEPSTFACRLDDAAATPCVSPMSLPAPSEGPHVFVVVATDDVGNASRQGVAGFTVDRTAPVTTLTLTPPPHSPDAMARFEFTTVEPNLLGHECSVDDAPFDVCFTPFELEELTQGPHTFAVRAVDLAGHVEAPAVGYAWNVDLEPPVVTISGGPQGTVSRRDATLDFERDDATARAECRLDAAPFASCTSPVSYTQLALGPHTFEVRATDLAGNVSATASRTWTIDGTGPSTTLTAKPPLWTQSTQARFEFTSVEPVARFECALDRGAYTPCTSPHSYDALTQREYVFSVRAVDALGNVGAVAAYTWTVVGPTTTLRVVAANLTSGNQQNYDAGEGIRILRGLRPDVVLLQEFNYRGNSTADQRAFVDAAFGARFAYFREAAPFTIPNGVVSRYPIITSGTWSDSRTTTTRGFAWARIDLPGDKDLWAVSVHLLTSSDTTRNAEATELVGFIRANVPAQDYLVVGGDLNTDVRTESCLTKLAEVVVTAAPYPADQAGNTATSTTRSKPYDWVLPNAALHALSTSVVLGTQTFTSGLVFDSRVYTPLSEVPPILATDSAATNMQHMAVVRDFVVAN